VSAATCGDPKTLLTASHGVRIGDVVALRPSPPQLAHLAFVEVSTSPTALAGTTQAGELRLVPGATYSEPEVASVASPRRRARARLQVKTGVSHVREREARILGAAEGMVKVVGEENTTRCSASTSWPAATEMIAEACSLLRLESTSEEMARHPTPPDAHGGDDGSRHGGARQAAAHLAPRLA